MITRLLIGALVWLASLGGIGWYVGSRAYSAGKAAVQSQWDAETAALAEAARQAEQAERAKEQRRAAAQKEAVDDATKRATQAETARVAADAAAERLRQRAAALAARCDRPGADPGAAAASAPAIGPGAVLADMLGRLDAAGRQLAAVADERGIAGRACERAYEALTTH